jgi:hypothetical protein
MRSIIAHQDTSSRKNPLVRITIIIFHVQVSTEDESRSSHRSDINGTLILSNLLLLLNRNSLHQHHRQSRMNVLNLLINQVTLLPLSSHFPSSSFKEQTMHISTLISFFLYIFMVPYLCNSCLQCHVIQWESIQTSCILHNSCQE